LRTQLCFCRYLLIPALRTTANTPSSDASLYATVFARTTRSPERGFYHHCSPWTGTLRRKWDYQPARGCSSPAVLPYSHYSLSFLCLAMVRGAFANACRHLALNIWTLAAYLLSNFSTKTSYSAGYIYIAVCSFITATAYGNARHFTACGV